MSHDLVNFLNKHAQVLNTNDVEAAGKESRDVEMGRETVRLHLSLNTDELKQELTDLISKSSAKKLLDGKSHTREEVQSWFTYGKDMNIKFMSVATALGVAEMKNPYKDSDKGTKYAYAHQTSIKAVLKKEIPVLQVTGEGKEQQATVAPTAEKVRT